MIYYKCVLTKQALLCIYIFAIIIKHSLIDYTYYFPSDVISLDFDILYICNDFNTLFVK